jgi:hypothetical protein
VALGMLLSATADGPPPPALERDGSLATFACWKASRCSRTKASEYSQSSLARSTSQAKSSSDISSVASSITPRRFSPNASKMCGSQFASWAQTSATAAGPSSLRNVLVLLGVNQEFSEGPRSRVLEVLADDVPGREPRARRGGDP